MTIADIISAFQTAAGTITSMNFKCCWLWQLTENESYPLVMLEPPGGEVTDYRNGYDTYEIRMWVMNILLQASTDTEKETWEDLQRWGYAIITYLKDTVYSGSDSTWLHRPARIVFAPYQGKGNDNAVAMLFEFKIDVDNCK